MKPEDFRYYRRNTAAEGVKDHVPSIFTWEEIRPVLAATARSIKSASKTLMAGGQVKTKYGLYWAEKREKTTV